MGCGFSGFRKTNFLFRLALFWIGLEAETKYDIHTVVICHVANLYFLSAESVLV